jgi:hypothetical protein
LNLHGTEMLASDGDFAVHMIRMREWLDSRRFEPAVFRYNHVEGSVVIRVNFSEEQEAAAFAREFGGKLVR